jgi:hypothetical protein
MLRLFRRKSKSQNASEDEERNECDADVSSKGISRLRRIVTGSAGARTSSVQNAKLRKNSVNSADLPRDPSPSETADVNPLESLSGDSHQEAVRNNFHSLTIVPSTGEVAHQNTALASSSTWDVSALKDVKRMLDPNSLARIAAPQPLNNFMDRLPTIERLEAEGLYTLVDPTIQLISEVAEEVGDQLTQLLSPRSEGHGTPCTSNTIPRLTYGGDSGRAAVPQLPYHDGHIAPNHSTQVIAVSHKEDIVLNAETEAFV